VGPSGTNKESAGEREEKAEKREFLLFQIEFQFILGKIDLEFCFSLSSDFIVLHFFIFRGAKNLPLAPGWRVIALLSFSFRFAWGFLTSRLYAV
jgi:hypothetical protein